MLEAGDRGHEPSGGAAAAVGVGGLKCSQGKAARGAGNLGEEP